MAKSAEYAFDLSPSSNGKEIEASIRGLVSANPAAKIKTFARSAP